MIAKEQYAEWRHHPATRFFLQFIRDRREALIGLATEAWLNGNESFKIEGEVDRGRIMELFMIEELQFDVIEEFYKSREVENPEG